MKPIRILIADDHALMRVGLRSMLSDEPDLDIVGEAANGEEVVRLARTLRPDVIIMDLMMPKLNGSEATRKILQFLPSAKVVILTSFGSSDELREAFDNGAVGMQPKEDPTENLIKTIHAVVEGKTVIPDEIATRSETASQQRPLTDKQCEILRMVIDGLATKQIAARLYISESGVKKHIKIIFSKLGAANRTEAVAIALRKHLLKI